MATQLSYAYMCHQVWLIQSDWHNKLSKHVTTPTYGHFTWFITQKGRNNAKVIFREKELNYTYHMSCSPEIYNSNRTKHHPCFITKHHPCLITIFKSTCTLIQTSVKWSPFVRPVYLSILELTKCYKWRVNKVIPLTFTSTGLCSALV